METALRASLIGGRRGTEPGFVRLHARGTDCEKRAEGGNPTRSYCAAWSNWEALLIAPASSDSLVTSAAAFGT